jgi:hypothetical protein
MGDIPPDSVQFDGVRLVATRFYEHPKPHSEEFELKVVQPAEADYWCAVNGCVLPLKVVKGQTCISTVSSLLSQQAKKAKDWPKHPHVYVVWKLHNPIASVWARWSKKWADRTSRPEYAF